MHQELHNEYVEVVEGYKVRAEEDVREELCKAFNAIMQKQP